MDIPEVNPSDKVLPGLMVSISVTGLVLAALVVLSWWRGRKASRELAERMSRQGWRLLSLERRWIFTGPYAFTAGRGIVFRVRALDEHETELTGYASVSTGWDDYATERIEVLWDAPPPGDGDTDGGMGPDGGT